MTKHKAFLVVAVGVLAGLISVLSAQSPSNTAGVVLTGTIKSATGQPLEGMLVTARGEGKTIKTTVFTDERGQYFFPPLEKGSYEMWAQAVGFETARATIRADGARTQNDFSMKKLEDFSRQLSGPEWLASLPASTPQDVRAKALFRSNCLGCHTAAWILQNRFDRDGWVKII